METLTISLFSTQIIPSTPVLDQYGGLELVVGLCAKRYDELGHIVHLFAPKGSYEPKNGLLHVVAEPGQLNEIPALQMYWNNEASRKALKDSDICHDHSWSYAPYGVRNELKTLCHTCHGPHPGFTQKPIDKPNLIAVSHNHAKQMMKISGCNWRAVENGIDLDRYPFKKEKEDYYLWISRFDWFKGAHRFIDICDKAQVKGILCGGSFGDNAEYVAQVKKKIDNSKYVKTIGPVGQETRGGIVGAGISHVEKVKLYQGAKAVIIPAQEYEVAEDIQNKQAWKQFIEPYGLICPEINATGGAFLGIPSGGWQTSIRHGINGFYANTVDEFVYYIKRVEAGEIIPENCRICAEHHNYKRMGDEYIRLYKEILEGRGW